MVPTVSQEKFFSNDQKKKNFIEKLMLKLRDAGFYSEQAYEDADTLIVETAINNYVNERPMIIVAEDIDILVILTLRAPTDKVIYFLKPSKGKNCDQLYSPSSFVAPSLNVLIGVIHAFCGCDTTSAFFNQGKSKIVKIFGNNVKLRNEASLFNTDNADVKEIERIGINIIAALYGGKKQITGSIY